MTRRTMFSFVIFALTALAIASNVEAVEPPLSFITPREGQTIGGDNVFLWVVSTDPEFADFDRPVTIEASLDAQNFVELPQVQAPDRGLGSYTTALDSTAFPSGPLLLRARFADDTTGTVIQVSINRLPQPSCNLSSAGDRGHLVLFDCSASSDPDGSIVSYEWDFGDGTTLVTQDPIVMHRYPFFGQFPFQLTVVDDDGVSSARLKIVSFKLEVDTLLLMGPVPNRLSIGGTGKITVTVPSSQGSLVSDLEIVFVKVRGSLTFTSGMISDDGTEARVVTDGSGIANMSFVAEAPGAALIQATVTGTTLEAFSLFFVQ